MNASLTSGLCLAFAFFACLTGVTVAAGQLPSKLVETSPTTTSTQAELSEHEPSIEEQSVYRDIVARAIDEFDAERFSEARALFLRAHEVWPSARTLRTLGMASFELRMYPQALKELQGALDDSRRPLPERQREHLRRLIEQASAFVGRYRVRIYPAHAVLLVDGAQQTSRSEPLVLAVGEHALIARAAGHGELRRVLDVRGRDDDELVLELEPHPSFTAAVTAPHSRTLEPPASRRPSLALPVSLLVVGAVGFVASSTLSGLALRNKYHLDSKCPDEKCSPPYRDQVDQMQRFANAATATVVVGAVTAGLGTYLLIRERRAARDRRSLAASTLRLGLGGLSFQGRFD